MAQVQRLLASGGFVFLPDGSGHNAKHGPAIELEKTGVDYVKFHFWWRPFFPVSDW